MNTDGNTMNTKQKDAKIKRIRKIKPIAIGADAEHRVAYRGCWQCGAAVSTALHFCPRCYARVKR